MNSFANSWLGSDFKERGLVLYWVVVVFSVTTAILSESIIPLLVPAILLFLAFSLHNLDKIFLLLFFLIPFSNEFQVTESLGTDMPSEPLIWFLFVVYLFALFQNKALRSGAIYTHPLTFLIFLHLGWIFFSFFFAVNQVIAMKFFLAKCWYVGVFYFLAYYMIDKKATLNKILSVTFYALLITAIIIFIRHGVEGGFTFRSINSVVGPFYRNKVAYSSIIALLLPLIWYLWTESKKYSGRRKFIFVSILFLLVALYFGYTRAAMISLFAAVFTPLLFRLRLTKLALAAAVLSIGGLSYYMFSGEKYLEYAPNYETTVMHYQYGNLLEATYQFEDISTMERFYRWIAGYYMVVEKPVTGFGPNNFYETYKTFTVRSYQTYVSDNPEQSGIHNYYLMMLIEQGIPGFLIFFTICVVFLIRAENLYQRLPRSSEKNLLIGISASMIIILLLQLMNDQIEVDKVGSFFWLWMAVLIKLENDWKRKKDLTAI